MIEASKEAVVDAYAGIVGGVKSQVTVAETRAELVVTIALGRRLEGEEAQQLLAMREAVGDRIPGSKRSRVLVRTPELAAEIVPLSEVDFRAVLLAAGPEEGQATVFLASTYPAAAAHGATAEGALGTLRELLA